MSYYRAALFITLCAVVSTGEFLSAAEPPAASPVDLMRSAIATGDLKTVRELAPRVSREQMPNLQFNAWSSPRAEVVEFLRDTYGIEASPLQLAALRGDAMQIRKLLSGVDSAARRGEFLKGYFHNLLSNSPLALAVRNGHTAAVKVLLEFGANPNEYGIYSLTPLANAAERGQLEIVRHLLAHGANVHAAPDAYTALMRACIGGHAEIAKLLLEAGADINAKHDDGQLPLHFAAKRGSAACVALLLKHGADLSAKAYGKDTPLDYARLYKRTEVIQLLENNDRK
ncbi:MAG: ankyrin repeat domain-containing protein [Planctomycetales bacterium]|nr:ankyrin repeat domain-containing protein [Planctomycetales bacterium]